MEDSSEMQSEENKISLDKNTKRILKTPAQITALEKFYNEHNYPTEEMKAELAEEIGLTEKQISSWFCHRRLKDKRLSKDENGRQDRSSGTILRQDSCGSNKQSDYRKTDPKEVESPRLYDRTSQYSRNFNEGDDTSSESSSSLQDKFYSQSEDPYDVNGSGRPVRPAIPKGSGNLAYKYKPSGYLKVKGEIVENGAITAVKRQLGKHYREDGPLLGIEFEILPPGAFSSLSKDPSVNGAFYVGEIGRVHSDVGGGRKQSRIGGNVNKFSFTFY